MIYQINGNTRDKVTGIINVTLSAIDGETFLNVFDAKEICISNGFAYNSELKA